MTPAPKARYEGSKASSSSRIQPSKGYDWFGSKSLVEVSMLRKIQQIWNEIREAAGIEVG
jgi:hypothetical protein